ncbi:tpr repeat-containing protein [Podospora didyma]|uniref:Tpr repeat-containing protein n=1 Tax=Podospora didyma TaxID=330526 RepID=A0AAE0TVD2_9PEZI|nr:tpr repeat-containing protein [Podospora didyma]
MVSHPVDRRSSPKKERQSPTSPIWQATIDKYYSELARSCNIQSSDELVAAINEIISQIEVLHPESVRPNTWTELLPILLGINDLVTIVIWRMGMNFKVAAVLWASFPRALPRMHIYERELRMTEALEKAMFDMYNELISPNSSRNWHTWSQFSRDFAKVIIIVQRYSRRVDKAADIIRHVQGFKHTQLRLQVVKLPYFMIPFGFKLVFVGPIGIHGLGGVGKSKLAIHYANTSMHQYKIIAWIPAKSHIEIVQAMSGLVNKLGLVEESEDDCQNVQRVRDWLNSAKNPFLLIFDDVDNIELLDQIWPSSNKGSIIITTRSPSQAFQRATITLGVESFSAETRTDISDFIRHRGYSYSEFLNVYDKSAERVFAKFERPVEYDHTPLTTFEIFLQMLSEKATSLAKLLACCHPDLIPERLLTETKAEMDGTDFLSDDFDFGDVVAELTQTSMVNRLSSSKALSMHRVVQFAVFYFDLAVKILYFDFPIPWKVRGSHQNHGWESWETCCAILPRVSWLMVLSEKHKVKSGNTTVWAKLKLPSQARSFFEFGLRIDDGHSGCIAAQAHRLLGHVHLDLTQPQAGFAAYLERAMAIHNAHDPSKMSRTLTIRAMTCLRAGEAEQALDAIRACWGLQKMTKEQNEASRYPDRSGDIMLLVYIYWLQGKKVETRKLASRTITMRRGVYGVKGGPRLADSLFTVALMLHEEGKSTRAARLLREVVEISGDAPGMRTHLARALWFLAGIEDDITKASKESRESSGTTQNSTEEKLTGPEDMRERAKAVRKSIEDREWADEDSDEGAWGLLSRSQPAKNSTRKRGLTGGT